MTSGSIMESPAAATASAPATRPQQTPRLYRTGKGSYPKRSASHPSAPNLGLLALGTVVPPLMPGGF
ncbi:hypothetical protein DB346_16260 [Verrucomicrobia bacterium LW23]|nr:hypothetical protein DB346_16260 [Verrucomicrobia bacterium LW23]